MGIYLFISAVLVTTALAIIFFVKEPLTYFKTKEGRGVAAGIGLAVSLGLTVALLSPKSQALEYFQGGEVFLGLDYTRKISPMCDTGVNDDKLTSNLGIRANLLQSDDKRSQVNFKYTHHSCAVNPDNKSYDAGGVEVIYKIW